MLCRIGKAGVEMPDGDVVPRTPVRLWKRPYRLLCSAADADAVADGICHSLVGSLRDKGGLPGAQDLASVMDAMVVGNLSLFDALAETHEVEWRYGAHIHTRVSAEAVRRLLVETGQGKVLSSEPLRTVAEESCWQLIRYQLLGRIGPDLHGVNYGTHEEYLRWEQQVLAPIQSRVRTIAANLARDPTGRSLPRKMQTEAPARPETATILETDLLEVR
jgi:hypothetical protein